MDCSKPFVYVQLPRVRDQQKAWHALSAQLKQVNLLCLSLYTWQCGVGQPSPKKQCSMQKVGYIWKACMNFANQMGRMLASGGLHQTTISVELLGSAVAATVCRHAGYNAPAAAHLSMNHHGGFEVISHSRVSLKANRHQSWTH